MPALGCRALTYVPDQAIMRCMGNQPQNRNRLQTTTWGITIHMAILLVASLSLACTPRNYTNDNDRLRRENLELEREIDQLQEKLDLRIAQIETMSRQQQSQADITVEPLRAVKAAFDRYTGAVDHNDDGQDDVIRLYVKVLDQHGQFIPVAGQADVQCVVIKPGEQPFVLTEANFSFEQFRAAYRAGLTGTHYSFELPLAEERPGWVIESTEAVATITITDATTGATLLATKTVQIDLRPIKTDLPGETK